MAIWKKPVTLDVIRGLMKNTMTEHIGMEITEIGDDFLAGTLPVDKRTQQYMGIIHGGASVVLAESLGSAASNLSCEPGFHSVGLEVNANHIRAGRPPLVKGVARPLHIGNRTHVWEIRITDTENRLVCISRLTTAVIKDTVTEDKEAT